MPALLDPAELAIATALFASVAEEMGVTLGRTAHSPNIKERRDFSCAVFDPKGRLVAQAAHIPVHLGAMPTAVQAALATAHPEPLGPRSGPSESKGHPEPHPSAARAPVEGFSPGDVVILNDPYLGGTHLPDITMVSPVFLPARGTGFSLSDRGRGRASNLQPLTSNLQLVAFVASRAHHADVGGIAPGSMPLAEELIQEGIVIPPIKLYEGGTLNRAVLALLLRNMRAPDERRGDLDAQVAAHRTGEERLREVIARFGLRQSWRRMDALMDYAERMTRTAIAAIPDGDYAFEDALDDDGVSDEPVPIRVRLSIRGDSLHCDFTGSAPERPSSVNAVAAVTRSAVYYVVRCLIEALVPDGESVPSNDGCFRPVSFTLPEGSVVNARPPRAVAAGNVETSQRIVDVLLGALAPALPHLIPAASQGTMNNVAIGSSTARPEPVEGPEPALAARPESVEGRAAAGRGGPSFLLPSSSFLQTFAYYETVGGGAGASPTADGLSAVHTHMTNTMNTPIEALEMAYPFRILEYAVRRGSGGAGRHRGGDGIVRTWQFLAPATLSLLSERRRRAPWGLAAGAPWAALAGQPGRNLLRRAPQDADVAATFRSPGAGPGPTSNPQLPTSDFPPPIPLPSKCQLKVSPGDILTLETPGGGGFGQ
ncbi:MAG: hydantoinase B/oxoprolinase family protein [Chloroflexi bacterium]|nr:hydantoinase B/oxoprolinase family protein [Chloroflexota bacterium]